ncbi:MAG: DnaJ domain-containing protein [Myxococcales bacterium]
MWGPLTFSTIELLIDNGAIPGKLQASRNGVEFYYPGRLPELRDAVPRELWGDSTEPLPDDGAPAVAAGGRPAAGPRPPPPTVGAPKGGPPVVGPRTGPPVVGRAGSNPSSAAIPNPAAAAAAASSPSSSAIPKPASKPAQPAAPRPAVAEGEGVPASGSLNDFPPFRIYYLVATANQTGKLTMNGVEASYEVFFKKGAPEAVRSSVDEEDLGSWLVERRVLASEKLAEARKMAGSFGGEILNALFGLQLLSPGDAFKHIGEHAASLLKKAFTLDSGTFSFDAAAPVPATAMPLGDRWKIICDMVREIPAADIKRRLGARMGAPIMKSGGRVEVAQLKLTPQEARAAVYFDGVRSLNQLVEAMPNEADSLVRTAFLLFRFEACSFAGGVDEGEVEDHPTPKPESDAPPPEVLASDAKPVEEPPLELDLAAVATEETPAAVAPPKPVAVARPEPPRGPPPKIETKAGPPKAEPPKAAPPGSGPTAARPAGPAAPAGKPPVVGGGGGAGGSPRPAINPGKPPVVGGVVGGAPRPAVNPGKPPVVPTVGKPAAAAAAAAPVARQGTEKPAAGGIANPGNDPKALAAYFEGLKGKNHFEVLGVPETAATPDVKKSYFQFAKWFHPDTAQGAPPEAGKLKADIFARINEANSVLADDKARANYLEELKAGLEQLDAAKIFASEETFQKACIHLKARKSPEAAKLFDEAIALYDKEGEYYIWRGWAKYLAAADKKAAKDASLKEIDKGCGMSPRCAMGPYFKGQIHKLLGDAATAQKLFKETLELDPNHLEAQREVRQR